MVDRLRAATREVRAFSRSGGDGRVRGDLATGEGLKAAVQGVETIVAAYAPRCISIRAHKM